MKVNVYISSCHKSTNCQNYTQTDTLLFFYSKSIDILAKEFQHAPSGTLGIRVQAQHLPYCDRLAIYQSQVAEMGLLALACLSACVCVRKYQVENPLKNFKNLYTRAFIVMGGDYNYNYNSGKFV